MNLFDDKDFGDVDRHVVVVVVVVAAVKSSWVEFVVVANYCFHYDEYFGDSKVELAFVVAVNYSDYFEFGSDSLYYCEYSSPNGPS